MLNTQNFVLRKSFFALSTLAMLGAVYSFIPWACDESHSPTGPRHPACWKPLVSPGPFPEQAPLNAEALAVWSLSGRYVAYVGFYDTCNAYAPAVYITSAHGTWKKQLNVYGSLCRWLPGDTSVIVNKGLFGGGELVVYNIWTHEERGLGIVTDEPRFDVSPDGSFLVFEGPLQPGETLCSLYKYRFSDGSITFLTYGCFPEISPNGQSIAFTHDSLRVFDLVSGNRLSLADVHSFCTWTPDGQWILFEDRAGRIFETDLAGNISFLAGEYGAESGAYGPLSVSPDGKSILYIRRSSDNFIHVWIMNRDGSHQRQFMD